MSRSVDVLVVGGGSAGWAAAGNLAGKGLSVLVVDRREPDKGGARWLNLVPAWCFDEAGLDRPAPPERWGGEHGRSHLTVAGTRAHVCVDSQEGLHVDMRALVARLRDRALARGAVLAKGTLRTLHVDREVEHADVEGVGRVHARLFVDASGLSGALRRKVPALSRRCPDVAPEDICAAAQFQYRVRDPGALRSFLQAHGAEPGESIAFLSVAGGFSTLTVFSEPELREVGVLTGSIPAVGAPNGASLLERFTARAEWLGERLHGGQGAIPLRRAYALLGAARVALVGDAACQVYGTHGSGVGMHLIAARILADSIDGDPGAQAGLDRYTRRFHRRYGGLLAGADAFRRLSQSLERGTVAGLMDVGLLDERVMGSGVEQRLPVPDAAWLLGRARSALCHPRGAARVLPTVTRMLALSALAPLAPPPRGLRARAYEALVDRLVGKTPSASAPVEHVEVDAEAPERARRELGSRLRAPR